MALNNVEIAEKFEELADLLEIEGANPFRVRSYRNAARNIRALSHSVSKLVEDNYDFTEIPGIGAELDKKIKTLVETGELPALDEIHKRLPNTLIELVKIEGLGPKRVKTLHEKLNIDSLDDLKKALEQQKIRQLQGFGTEIEDKIRQALKHFTTEEKRFLRADIVPTAEDFVEYIQKSQYADQVTIAGSYRRKKETVGDIDILATSKDNKALIEHFVKFPKIKEIISKGSTRSTVRLSNGLQVDLRVVAKGSYGAALHYFTGSKNHNIAIRGMAQKKDLKINEYGVYEGKKKIAGKTEKEIFKLFNLDFIPPELRENQGEIEAAAAGKLPKLIELEDIRGDLHCHTKATDGQDSLENMVKAARDMGYEYIGITDHTKRLTVAKGQDEKRLKTQIEQIDELNQKYKDIRILKGAEVDIHVDGSLDLEDWILEKLDFTVCSVHHKFDLSENKQTQRIVKAIQHPHFTILGHPSGRQLNRRSPYQVEMDQVLEAAAEHKKLVEINAQPERLDLTDQYCRLAKSLGVKLVISTDAHLTSHFQFMHYGVDQARRGWVEANDVANTNSLKRLFKLFGNEK